MKHFLKKLFLCVAVCTVNIYADRQSSVITLQFPAGAENTGLGECGVSLANTAFTVFWNPANVACLYEETYLNNSYSQFHEALLPKFTFPDLYHDFSVFSTTINNALPNVDIGYAYFRNFINFGTSNFYDSTGVFLDSINADETVTGSCFGLRAFDIISIGFTLKNYNSRLAPRINQPTYPRDGISTGSAYDIGLRLNKKFEDISGLFYMNPALGISVLNFAGDSAKYIDTSSSKDPLPKTGFWGTSIEFNALDIIGYTFVFEEEYNLLSAPYEQTIHRGQKFQLTPFYAILRGSMDDYAGQRFEYTEGYVISFNLQQTFAMTSKIVKAIDLLYESNYFAGFNKKYNSCLTIAGFVFRPNVYYSKSHCVIFGKYADAVREGQTRDDWSIGIGIVAQFPNYCNIKDFTNTTTTTGQPVGVKPVVPNKNPAITEEDAAEVVE